MWGVVAVIIPALALLAYVTREALMRSDRAARAEVAQAHAEGAAATWQATADTLERLRRAEKLRADTLDEELARHDQTAADHPDPDARRRVREAWRLSTDIASAAPGARRDEGPVSDPAATPSEP